MSKMEAAEAEVYQGILSLLKRALGLGRTLTKQIELPDRFFVSATLSRGDTPTNPFEKSMREAALTLYGNLDESALDALLAPDMAYTGFRFFCPGGIPCSAIVVMADISKALDTLKEIVRRVVDELNASDDTTYSFELIDYKDSDKLIVLDYWSVRITAEDEDNGYDYSEEEDDDDDNEDKTFDKQ